jgi:NMD protein affecting ribosome stability and mRNA decay
MYCVCCGTLLDEENRAGIVCRTCKQNHRARRGHHWGQPITVRYCFHCGRRYTPLDASVAHSSCHFVFRSIAVPTPT